MKKIFFVLFLIFVRNLGYSQNYNDVQNLRNSYKELSVISPTPEMKALIRFDNAEVSTYTGIPDVSVPLFNFECTKDLNFNIGLKYHPDAVKLEERAGSTGLGWSLMAGGSITRVVRGLPDEIVATIAGKWMKRGINTSTKVTDGNDLDNFIDNPNYLSSGNQAITIYDKLFESYESGMFDTQYDLYYYNFMGISGSFYVKVNDNVSNATVVKLDNNTVRIIPKLRKVVSYQYDFEIDSFTIYDEKGNMYEFDVKDYSKKVSGYKNSKLFYSSNSFENLNDEFGIIPIQDTNPVTTAYHLLPLIYIIIL